MGSFFSSCKEQKYTPSFKKDPALDMVDQDGKTYLKYIMNYDSIPYFIPQINYAKVTDIRQNYTIVVAARFPNNNSPLHRFPVRLKHVCNGDKFYKTFPGFESNLHNKAKEALFPLICSSIVELRDVENRNGMLYADVYFSKGADTIVASVSEWLVDNNLALDEDNKYTFVKM